MHYHKSKFLRFANAAFEFLLLILTFIFAGWLRSYTPMGSQFFMWDIWTFLPISALYALVIVGCNAVLGSYRTLHMRNSIKQLFLIALTSLMGLALMATAFYVFRDGQLSRLTGWRMFTCVSTTSCPGRCSSAAGSWPTASSAM